MVCRLVIYTYHANHAKRNSPRDTPHMRFFVHSAIVLHPVLSLCCLIVPRSSVSSFELTKIFLSHWLCLSRNTQLNDLNSTSNHTYSIPSTKRCSCTKWALQPCMCSASASISRVLRRSPVLSGKQCQSNRPLTLLQLHLLPRVC